jgi:hypothetical protein
LFFSETDLKHVYGIGDGSSVIIFLNGFQHKMLGTMEARSFYVGVSDGYGPFDLVQSGVLIRTGQVTKKFEISSKYYFFRLLI